MKRTVILLILIAALSSSASAQTTSVTLQATDLGGQSWNNGTYSATLAAPAGVVNPTYFLGGIQMTPAQLQLSGALNASGGASFSLGQNPSITPVGSSWTFTVCPQATATCYTQSVTVSGASQTVTLNPPAILINLSNSPANTAAYADIEITGVVLGATYFNLTSSVQRVCTAISGSSCTTWANNGGGGGSGCVPAGGASGNVLTDNGAGACTSAGNTVTGTAAFVRSTNPVLTTPNLGTPSAATLTNATGLPISTGVSGLGAGVATLLATPTSANLLAALTTSTGTGLNVFGTSPTLITPNLGTPTALNLSNATGLPCSALPTLTGDTTSVACATTTVKINGTAFPTSATVIGSNGSAQPIAATTTGSGTTVVLATSPVLTTPNLGTPSALVLTNSTALPLGATPLTTTQDILYDNAGALGRLPIVANGNCLGATAGVWAPLACSGGLTASGPPTANQLAYWTTATNLTGTGPGLTGQIATANNASAPTFNSPGLPGRTVAGATDTILCDSGTAIRDRAATEEYTAAAVTITVPDASTAGCTSNFVTTLISGNTTVATVNRTTASTFTLYNGAQSTSGLTTFTLNPGHIATLSSRDNTNWIVRIVLTPNLAYGTGGGTAQAQTVTVTTGPIPYSLATGQEFCWTPSAANTAAAPTLAVNGLAATTITKTPNHTALVANDLLTSRVACAIYDGANMELQNPQTATGGSSALSAITAATGANTIASGNNPQTWNWAQTTDAQDAFTFGETSAATGGTLTNALANQAELHVSTASGSTATPVEIEQLGVTGATGPPLLQLESTWNNASLVGEGILENVTNTSSAAGSKLLDLRVGNTAQFTVDKAGNSVSLTSSATGTAPAVTPGTGGLFACTEGTSATGLASTDILDCNSTQHAAAVNNNNTGDMPVSRVVCVNVTPVTVTANVTTDQNLMSCTLAANTLNVVGRTLKIWVAGVYTTPAASVATINLKAKLCTVSGCGSGTVINLATITSSANPGTVTNNAYNLTLYPTTQTAGASSVYEAHGIMGIDLGAANTSQDSFFNDTNTAVTSAIDSTAQLFLQISTAFSVASASNSSTERQLIVEVLN